MNGVTCVPNMLQALAQKKVEKRNYLIGNYSFRRSGVA